MMNQAADESSTALFVLGADTCEGISIIKKVYPDLFYCRNTGCHPVSSD
ncbi:hypothetical protein [Jeotgalibacillus sp. R-1-5s-1]|nr:hypothetical protein [Jeotgalibacillus sp. R-1-5s-1]